MNLPWSGKILCGQTRQKLKFFKGLCPIASVVKVTPHFKKKNIMPAVECGGVTVCQDLEDLMEGGSEGEYKICSIHIKYT